MPPFQNPNSSTPSSTPPRPEPPSITMTDASSSSNATATNPPAPATAQPITLPQPIPPPPPREVATGVANLGNTCYMNAALQALAHAPELCHALDAECHVRNCPIALRNERRRRRRLAREQLEQFQREHERKNHDVADGNGHEDDGATNPDSVNSSPGSHHSRENVSSGGAKRSKSSRRGKSRDRKRSASRDRKSEEDVSSGNTSRSVGNEPKRHVDEEEEFCTLCEVERLLGRVHSRPEEVIDDSLLQEDDSSGSGADTVENDGGSPVQRLNFNSEVPSNHSNSNSSDSMAVVPETFVSGFMSKVAPWFRRGVQEDSHEFLRLLIDAMQNSCKEARTGSGNSRSANAGSPSSKDKKGKQGKGKGNRGRIEDEAGQQSEDDVEYPFRLFRGTVESNVKCSACRAVSRKIDPIEDIGLDILPVRTNKNATSTGRPSRGATTSSSRSTSPTALSMGLADVQQALERFISIEHLAPQAIPVRKHVHCFYVRGRWIRKRRILFSQQSLRPWCFQLFLFRSSSFRLRRPLWISQDRRPRSFQTHFGYETLPHPGSPVDYFQESPLSTLRRGGSHWQEFSQRSLRRIRMLFYRVMDHPVAKQLKLDAEAKAQAAAKAVAEAESARLKMEEELAAAAAIAKEQTAQERPSKNSSSSQVAKSNQAESSSVETKEQEQQDNSPSIGKRKRPDLTSGEEWAKDQTSLPEDFYQIFRRIEEFITDNVTFNPEFFRYITEEYDRMSSKMGVVTNGKGNYKKIKKLLGKGPSGVYPPVDVKGGAQDIREGILDLFHQIAIMYKSVCKTSGGFLLQKKIEEYIAKDEPTPTPTTATAVQQTVLPSSLTVGEELIIPDPTESYDGAL